MRRLVEHLGVDDALADGGGDFAAGQVGPGELENDGDQNRLFDGEGPRPHRRAHGVGNVIGAHAQGHQETGAAGNEQHQGAVFEHPLHREPLLVCRTLAGKQQLKMAANLLSAVGQVTDPVDDLV